MSRKCQLKKKVCNCIILEQPQSSTPQTTSTSATGPSNQTNTNPNFNNPFANIGNMGGFGSGMGGFGGGFGGMDQNSMMNMMNNPMYQQMMKDVKFTIILDAFKSSNLEYDS